MSDPLGGPSPGGVGAAGPPPAEVDVTPAIVDALLRAQAPAFADLPRTLAASGWDNAMIRLGGHAALRLPRRAFAAALVTREQRWLPVLAPLLPVAVPVPLVAGRASAGYPWSWSVVPWYDGVAAAARPRASRSAWAAPLARAFATLHRAAPPDAPHNAVRAVPLATRDAVLSERLDRGVASGSIPPAAREIWRRGVAAPAWRGAPQWVHGDPHPANLLLRPAAPRGAGAVGCRGTGGDQLTALLDFGDLAAGDPACDLAAAWLVFDSRGRTRFRRTYDALRPGASDPGRWERAAAWATSMASSVVVDAPADPVNGPWARAALAALAL